MQKFTALTQLNKNVFRALEYRPKLVRTSGFADSREKKAGTPDSLGPGSFRDLNPVRRAVRMEKKDEKKVEMM